MSHRVKTPYKDINNTPIYTGDIVKHYNDYDDPYTNPSYDIGIVYEDKKRERFCRTTVKYPHPSFEMSEKCLYVVLGNINDRLADIAVKFLLCHQCDKDDYYDTTSAEAFFRDFHIEKYGERLSDDDVDYALKKLAEFRRIH